jgi:hypothetical protein
VRSQKLEVRTRLRFTSNFWLQTLNFGRASRGRVGP